MCSEPASWYTPNLITKVCEENWGIWFKSMLLTQTAAPTCCISVVPLLLESCLLCQSALWHYRPKRDRSASIQPDSPSALQEVARFRQQVKASPSLSSKTPTGLQPKMDSYPNTVDLSVFWINHLLLGEQPEWINPDSLSAQWLTIQSTFFSLSQCIFHRNGCHSSIPLPLWRSEFTPLTIFLCCHKFM